MKYRLWALEEKNGFEFGFVPAGSLTSYDYGYVNGKIAGIDGSTAFYYFDEGRLFGAEYKFIEDAQGYTYKETALAGYRSIQTALEKKYGNPDTQLSPSGDNRILIFPRDYRGVKQKYLYPEGGQVIADYAQWLILLDDGSAIVISHVLNAKEEKYYHHRLYYTHYDAETVSDVVLQHEEEQLSIQDDL